MERMSRRGRWLALGLIVGLGVAWGGFSVAESAPSSITTCTKNSNNKTKVITSSLVAKCTAKGKGVAQTWSPTSQLTAAQRYEKLMDYEGCIGGLVPGPCGSNDFSGMNLHGNIFFFMVSTNLSGADLSNAYFAGLVTDLNLTGANLSNSSWAGLDPWSFAQPVMITNSNFTNANFTGANFFGSSIDVTGSLFSNTTCPDGTNSNSHGNTCVGFGM
jgi:uncharacterized protein YjbI with pentapeptide repeats